MSNAIAETAIVVPIPMPAVFISRKMPAKMSMVSTDRTIFEQSIAAKSSDHVALTWIIFFALRNVLS